MYRTVGGFSEDEDKTRYGCTLLEASREGSMRHSHKHVLVAFSKSPIILITKQAIEALAFLKKKVNELVVGTGIHECLGRLSPFNLIRFRPSRLHRLLYPWLISHPSTAHLRS